MEPVKLYSIDQLLVYYSMSGWLPDLIGRQQARMTSDGYLDPGVNFHMRSLWESFMHALRVTHRAE